MFDFFKRKKKTPDDAKQQDFVQQESVQQEPQPSTADEIAESQADLQTTTAPESEAALIPESALVQQDEAISETEQAVKQAADTQDAVEHEEPAEPEAAPAPSEVSATHIVADDIPDTVEEFDDPDVMVPVAEKAQEEKKGFFGRMAAGLSKTRSNLTDGLSSLLLGKKEIDDDMMEDLETQLIMADVGVEATNEIISRLTQRVGRKELRDSDALYEALIEELQDILAVSQKPLVIDSSKKPYVILMVGINGVGKTTTIGKLAKQFQARGKSVMLAAGDTFRAAAVEQLQVWGERNDVPVVAQHTGADSASVLFDAVQAATSRGVDVLIADTAGRLHNKDNLMQELEKVVRVMKKIDDTAPHEVMLVLDAGTGQNAINQTKTFLQSVGVTGLTLTKLDGTAKGGIIFALAKQFGLPVRYIGVGEKIEDLRPFNADDYTRALFRIGDD
ncbi:MAG: signal recognition particle-docking protein FtsY [Pseudomonadota bacterium]|nr:signal recognition particle-docking protein FtsY [Pseudomonadota bacterium]MEC8524483.1 signal recognition particle-docking protein FtsY [Pseudomonadota bacterium]